MSENNLVALAPSYTKAITQVPDHYETMIAFVKAQMQKDIDYVVIPGTGSKPTLLKLELRNFAGCSTCDRTLS